MPNTTILVVDDDSELREAVTEQLSMHEEFEVTAVGSGREGVQAAKVGRCARAHARVLSGNSL